MSYESENGIGSGAFAALVLLLAAGLVSPDGLLQGGRMQGPSDYLHAVLGGPGRLRFIIQPLVAILLGIRDGRRDAAAGDPPYVLAVLFVRGRRKEELSSALRSIITPLLVGFMVSLIVQHYIFRSVRLWHAIVFGIGLIALPYVVARGLTNRFIQLRRSGQSAEPLRRARAAGHGYAYNASNSPPGPFQSAASVRPGLSAPCCIRCSILRS